MRPTHPGARKAPTNLSIRVDLVRKAKALKLNLSELLESSLESAILEAEQRAWLDANREAIDVYNAAVAARGAFSDGWRRF